MAKTATKTKTASKKASKKSSAKASKKPAEGARKAVAGVTTAKESKSAIVDRMLKSEKGATRQELSAATGWPHVNLNVAANRAGMKLVEAEGRFRLIAK